VLYGREPFRDAVKRLTDGAARTWCSIPSAARSLRRAYAASPGARAARDRLHRGIGLARTNLLLTRAPARSVSAPARRYERIRAGEVRQKALTNGPRPERSAPISRTACRWRKYAKAMRLLVDRKAIGRVALTMR